MNAVSQLDPTRPNLGMQVTTFENPMGIDGFEFVEFAAPAGQGELLHAYFRRMGFTAVLRHRTRPITVYRQGGVNFLVNEDPDSFAADFAKAHGPSACGFAIRFQKPASEVCQLVLGNGGEAIDHKPQSKAVDAPVVKGIGDCMLYLVDRYGGKGSIYDGDYEPIPGADQNPLGFGLTFIDHLTHNLYFGNMQKWSDYYERLFNFREIASEPVYKVIASAVANAERTDNLRRADLYVSQAFVDEGVTLRRIRPRARGGWGRILKRSSHITVVVEPRTEPATRGQVSTRSKEK